MASQTGQEETQFAGAKTESKEEEMRPSWDEHFISICHSVRERSPDTSTKTGSVVVGPDKEIRSTGYNGFVRGIRDDVPERFERPRKYKWFEHAERNAIYNAARMGTSLKGCVIYCTWPPCSDCARGIIQSGISEVVVETLSVPTRWFEDFSVGLEMIIEAGGKVRLINSDEAITRLEVSDGESTPGESTPRDR